MTYHALDQQAPPPQATWQDLERLMRDMPLDQLRQAWLALIVDRQIDLHEYHNPLHRCLLVVKDRLGYSQMPAGHWSRSTGGFARSERPAARKPEPSCPWCREKRRQARLRAHGEKVTGRKPPPDPDCSRCNRRRAKDREAAQRRALRKAGR